jgi:hypothetical protein
MSQEPAESGQYAEAQRFRSNALLDAMRWHGLTDGFFARWRGTDVENRHHTQ